jgi:hypothetical protein
VRNSQSFQRSIDDGPHVIELHAWRSPETCTFATFIYEKGLERLLRHITGTDENEVIRQALVWCEANRRSGATVRTHRPVLKSCHFSSFDRGLEGL